jgi:excisionase family DNA binding protein
MTTDDGTSERFLSSDELADRWQVSTRTVKRLVDRRQIHFVRIGRQIRFKLSDVLAYEKKMRS